MLSILIPIYNQDVTKLVMTLVKQCNKAGIRYQILCFDDGSIEKYKQLNKVLGQTIHVNYTELQENLGRSRIRNWLGKAAYFEYLLFLDGDTKITSNAFIKTYVQQLDTDTVISGGRIYSKSKPRSPKKFLHWKYGSTRESLKAKKRNKNPYMNFHSNNFVIPAHIFAKYPFDQQVVGYGYEDTLYAEKLKFGNIKIKHIDNPTVHTGLENADVFIKKTINATDNLAKLYSDAKLKETRLIKSYEFLKNYDLWGMFERIYEFRKKKIELDIQSNNPTIMNFNLWKLYNFGQKLKSKTKDEN